MAMTEALEYITSIILFEFADIPGIHSAVLKTQFKCTDSTA